MKSISVIVSSRSPSAMDLHRRNIAATAGAPHEYLGFSNAGGARGICSVYNQGVDASHGDVLVFMHEDAYFLEKGWGHVLLQKFGSDESIGLIGVAGTQYLFADVPFWARAGRPFVRGRIVHELDNGASFFMTVFSRDKADTEVVAVDGVFFAIRRSLFNRIRFDETTFDGFHFYDIDICMQVRETHRIVVTWDMLLKHRSGGSFDGSWKSYAGRFSQKWAQKLPATCAAAVPDMSKPVDKGENFDLKGKAPQAILE
jgi:GT2 family glycosyltransferase